ncbi:MAG: hypothetical protein K6U04_01585 [Armatimonadetes bacterium]|nr:hypothetical protein [Armatimonadota bacterium]
MIDKLNVLFANWKKFLENNPEVRQSIQEGYEVGAYDEETGMIVAFLIDDAANEDKTLKITVIEDAYVIKKNGE